VSFGLAVTPKNFLVGRISARNAECGRRSVRRTPPKFLELPIVIPKLHKFTHNGETENTERPRRAARRARERRQGKEEECER
jgi:hypothetical protein